MRGSGKKCKKKPPFLVILGQKGPFWTVFDQNGQNYQKQGFCPIKSTTTKNDTDY